MVGVVGLMMEGGGLLVLAVLLKATLILGVAWILATVARRSSAAVRHGIWVAALLGVVTLPFSSIWLPPLEVDLPLGLIANVRADQELNADPASTPRLAAGTAAEGGVAASIDSGATSEDALFTDSSAASGVDWRSLLLGGWLLGVLARVTWLGAQLARVRHLTRSGATAVNDCRSAAAGEIGRILGVHRAVMLLESDQVATPLTCGLMRPIILLPHDSRAWPEERLRVVLLHELAHIRRWDYVTCLIAEAASALYWPVPLVWIARRSVLAEQEQASDDLVLAAGTPAVDYADHLLAIARTLRGEGRTLPATIGMAREIGLKRRIRTILDGRTRRIPLRSRDGAATVCVLLGFALPVAALRPASASEDQPANLAALTTLSFPEPALPAPAVEEAPEGDVYLWLEAEQALLHAGMELREDLDASSGQFILAEGAGEATLSLQLPRAGEYAVWARLQGDEANAAGFTIFLDEQPITAVRSQGKKENGRGWRWVRLGGATAGMLRLAAGSHSLRLIDSGGERRLDRVFVTTDGGYEPSDRGALAADFAPQHVWIDVGAGTLTGVTEYAFEVDTPGSYVLWARVLGRDGAANSFFLSVDDGPEVIWDAPRRELGAERGRWIWDPASAREIGGRTVDPLILQLEPGRHAVRLRPREDGTGLGGLLVTNDLAYRPSGNPPGTPPVRVWLEPETASPVETFRVREGGGAMGMGYLEAAERDRGRTEPGDGGSAALRFELPQPGVYTLWGRTVARTDGEDSFWIRVNDGPWVRWNGIPRSREWRWSAVHDGDGDVDPVQFALPAGENLIEIARREGGARVDRLLLTNEDRFEPAGTGVE